MDKAQYKMVPVEPTPEMIAAAYAGGHGGGPAADYAAMLAAAPQPPSASGEREAFDKWWMYQHQTAANRRDGDDYMTIEDDRGNYLSAFKAGAEQARAALAPSPGIDAAEQKPVYTIQVRGTLHTWEPTAQAFKLTNGTYSLYACPPAARPDAAVQEPIGYASDDGIEALRRFGQCSIVAGPARSAMTDCVHPVYAAPPAAQPDAEWLAEAGRLVDAYVAARFAYTAAMDAVWPDAEHAALLAHLRSHHAPT